MSMTNWQFFVWLLKLPYTFPRFVWRALVVIGGSRKKGTSWKP